MSHVCGSSTAVGTFGTVRGLVYSDKICISTDLVPSFGGQINSYQAVLSTHTIVNLVFSSSLRLICLPDTTHGNIIKSSQFQTLKLHLFIY